jgi:predicted Zn-dependent protease
MRNALLTIALTLAAGQFASGQSTTPSLMVINQSLANKDFNGVVAMSDVLLRSEPRNPQLWLARAIAFRGLTRTRESLNAFNEVLVVEPDNVTALEGASEAAFLLKAPSAWPLIQELLRVTPTNSVANAMAGSLSYERGDCSAATKYFSAGKSEVRNNATASLQLSHCLLLDGHPTQAVTTLEALSGDDKDGIIVYDLAFALFTAGQYKESAEHLEYLRARHAGGAEALDLLGAAYGKLDRVQDALDAYRGACEEAPTVPGYYIDLAMFAMERSSEIAAVQILNTAIERVPTSSALLTFRGAIYSFLGETAKADQDFEAAEQVDPSSGFGRVGRSLSLRDQGKRSEAEAQLRQQLTQTPNDVEAKYFLAEILADDDAASRLMEAKVLLEDVSKERPEDPNVLLVLGKIYLKSKNPKGALPLLLHAQKLDPASPAILNRLLQDYRILGLTADVRRTADALRRTIDDDRNSEVRRNRFHIVATAQ